MNSRSLLLAALSLPILALAAGPPDIDRASVTLPYAELRALWKAAHPGEKIPAEAPEPHVVQRADLQLTLGADASTLAATFDLEALASSWQHIPLVGGEVQLEKADAGERAIVWEKGFALLTNQPGKTRATLQLVAAGLKTLTPAGSLRLTLGCATVKRLLIAGTPPGLEVRVNGKVGSPADGGVILFHLPSQAGEVHIHVAAPRVETPPQPSVWKSQSQVLVRNAESRLLFQSRVFAQTDGGSATEMLLVLPLNAGAITVSGDDLADWTAARSENGQRLLRIRWKTAEVLDREIAITYAVPLSPLAEQWQLLAPATPGDANSRHLFVIVPGDGLELKGDALRSTVVAHRLPAWMRSEVGGASFVTAESEPQLALQTHWLPAIAAAEAVITEAKCQLRLIADGSTRTAATYTIRHETPLAWRLELPANIEILSCTVGNQRARPVQREPGTIEFNLPGVTDAKKGTTSIALEYAAKTDPLDPVSGEAALELPRTALFIERVDWTITLPTAFEVTAFHGNVEANSSPEGQQKEGVIHFHKNLCRAERPTVALFYQRRALEN